MQLFFSYLLLLISKTDFDLFIQLSTLSIIFLSEFILEFLTVLIEFEDHLSFEVECLIDFLLHAYPLLFYSHKFIKDVGPKPIVVHVHL